MTASQHWHTSGQKWGVGLRLCITTLLGSNGQRDAFTAMPYSRGAICIESVLVHRHIARAQWAVRLLHYAATLLRSTGQWDSFRAPPTS